MKKTILTVVIILLIIFGVYQFIQMLERKDAQNALQRLYDHQNYKGNRAFCIIAANAKESDYPYTTFYYGTEFEQYDDVKKRVANGEARMNGQYNKVMHILSKYGLFTETPKGYDKGFPIYEYKLTDKGREYVRWGLGATNFCFGRLVIEKVTSISYSDGSINSNIKTVRFKYHIENIPDWIQDPELYPLYRFSKEEIEGKQSEGSHLFAGSRSLQTMNMLIRP